MSIKSILCVFGGETRERIALDTALSLAQTNHGRLRILHVAAPPVTYGDGLGMTAYGLAAYGDGSTIDLLEKDNAEMTAAARAYSIDRCKSQGVPLFGEGAEAPPVGTHAVFRKIESAMANCLPAEGRTTDLIVTSYDNHPDGDFTVVLTALFQTGRPVLLLPNRSELIISTTGYAQSVAVAWDGSLSAARALRDAIPHLQNARDVYLLKVDDTNDSQVAITETDILAYLSGHGIVAQILCVLRGDQSVGGALLDEVSRLQAGLLVMGAYGHGHIGEMIVGGATDHVLKHTTIPLLLVH
ncbi:MAG: universal stress protein [Asticcacaulis sp.]